VAADYIVAVCAGRELGYRLTWDFDAAMIGARVRRAAYRLLVIVVSWS
jgi:hypothetical protein